MNKLCDIIQDLLPLYCDDACSAQSRDMVEEHLRECAECSQMMKKMQDTTYNDCLEEEKEDVLRHYKNKLKKRILLTGLGIAAGVLLICLVVNLATGHALDWFFIVFGSLLVFGSITAVPLLAEEKKRLWTFVSFTGSLLLLLVACAIFSGGGWFYVAAVSTLFGLSVVFFPFAMRQLPLPGAAAQNKGLIVMAVDTVLFYLLILTCGLYSGTSAYWKPALLVATAAALFCWVLFAIIRYLRANGLIRAGACVLVSGIFFSLIHDFIQWSLGEGFHFSLWNANLSAWNTDVLLNANSYLLLLLTGCIVGGALLIAGAVRSRKEKRTK